MRVVKIPSRLRSITPTIRLDRAYQTNLASDRAEEFFNDVLNNEHVVETTLDTTEMESNLPDIPTIPSFHELSSGGYNGRLAMAFRSRQRATKILEIMDTMRRMGERPTTILSYNYMLSALLETGRRKDAFLLLREIETRKIEPDLFTFEQLLYDLGRDTSLAITVDELFHLMQVKYNIKPSSSCWTSRLKAWMNKQNERRVIALFEEMRKSDPRSASDISLYAIISKTALARNLWLVASQVLSCVTPTIPITEDSDREFRSEDVSPTDPPIIFTSYDYYGLLVFKYGNVSAKQIPFLRYIMRQLEPTLIDEGCYARLLYLAAHTGNSIADLAYTALRKLSLLYSREEDNNLAMPKHYLQAYVECINTSTIQDPLNSSLGYMPRVDLKHIELARDIEKIIY